MEAQFIRSNKSIFTMNSIPLVVDLDGTLVLTDMLYESMVKAFQEKPLSSALKIPYWLSRGKATLKQILAKHYTVDVAHLPYNSEFLNWLQAQRSAGRKLILCTASDHTIASAIATHLGLFDEVMASDGHINLSRHHKAEALVQRFGKGGFDYAGNSRADLAVWSQARRAILVNASDNVRQKAQTYCEIEPSFSSPKSYFKTGRSVLRVHQWLKNSLLAIPLLAAHKITSLSDWALILLAFIAFSVCASSVYIANDLLDLESDREHPRKSKRPFAAGKAPIGLGFILAPSLFVISIALALQINLLFLVCLLAYFLLTCAYSLWLKRLVLLDCLTLALLYTLRIVAGAMAIGMGLSFWLLAFSVFLFLSLAFVKRYAELQSQHLKGKEKVQGRGYHTADAPLVQMSGICAGYAAVLVLALYLNSDAVLMLYRTPTLIWGDIPILLFWINWMWLRAHRGEMHDDPVIFAIKDKVSLFSGFAFTLILAAGTVNWPW